MKKILAGVILVVLVGGGSYYWKKKSSTKKQMAAVTRTIKVEPQVIERTVDATGEVTPLNRVEIKPPIQGRIEELLVDEGSKVKRGQILAWMSSSDRAAILDAARANGPAEVKKWQDTYKPTPIIAPLSGVIILRNVVVGQTIEGSTILFAMSDQLIVKAQVDEADIGRVKVGLPAAITLDAYPDSPINGRVSQILYEGKNVSNVITYGVKIVPETVPPFFRSQMTANVSLILERRENTIVVPSQAISDGAEGKQVMVPGPDGKPLPRAVEVGIVAGEKSEITSGLAAGDTIVIVRSRYTPQKGPQSSPLTMGGRPNSGSSGQSGNQSGSGQRRQN